MSSRKNNKPESKFSAGIFSAALLASLILFGCGGGGGGGGNSVTGGAGTTGVSGAVDSSLRNHHQESANLVYAFAGFNTTTGIPVATASVTQDTGGCTFRYDLAGLPAGNYTVALSNDSGASFRRSANVTVSGTGAM